MEGRAITNDKRPSISKLVAVATGILSVADTSWNDKVTNGRGPSVNDSITAPNSGILSEVVYI